MPTGWRPELAELTGESLTSGVTDALRERLERKRREPRRDDRQRAGVRIAGDGSGYSQPA